MVSEKCYFDWKDRELQGRRRPTLRQCHAIDKIAEEVPLRGKNSAIPALERKRVGVAFIQPGDAEFKTMREGTLRRGERRLATYGNDF